MSQNQAQCFDDLHSFIDSALAYNYNFMHDTDGLDKKHCDHKKTEDSGKDKYDGKKSSDD